MAEKPRSRLLDAVLDRAEQLRVQHNCSNLTIDFIFVAYMQSMATLKPQDAEETEEFARVSELLSDYRFDAGKLEELARKWKDRTVTQEAVLIGLWKKRATNDAEKNKKSKQTAELFLKYVLKQETAGIRALKTARQAVKPEPARRPPEPATASAAAAPQAAATTTASAAEATPQTAEATPSMLSIVQDATRFRRELEERVLGQAHAIAAITSGYFEAMIRTSTEKDRVRPLTTFLFAGPPGVGKTYLAEQAAAILGKAYRRFDMSEFSTNENNGKLNGSDGKFMGAQEGELTGFVKKNPNCIILLDEIEKAHFTVIHMFLQVLDAGRLFDQYTHEEISFKDTILIFTTNAGRELYSSESIGSMKKVSREVILNALTEAKGKDDKPFFPPEICSRFSNGNVVMFDHLRGDILQKLVEKTLQREAKKLSEGMGVTVEFAPEVATALLLAEGAAADARKVQGGANSFFYRELDDLYEVIDSADGIDLESVRDIDVNVVLEDAPEDIRELFLPKETLHALLYTRDRISIGGKDPFLPEFHRVSGINEAQSLIAEYAPHMVLIDLFSGVDARERYFLNYEDFDSPARNFFFGILEKYPSMPILLAESSEHRFTKKERESFLARGVRGFLRVDAPDASEVLKRFCMDFFRQASMVKLARGNRLVSYETAQRLPGDGSAEIVLYDMKLVKAIKAGDANKVMSMMSTPDLTFDDVIGCDDAKKELQFYVSYMQQPHKYSRSGVNPPRGLILYGPPGTGKTMLAKAFAAESKATFIPMVGAGFKNKYIGEGARAMRELFATARRYAPAVIFIDEVDVIARRRTGNDDAGSKSNEDILTTLFSEMDGFTNDPSKPVFVLCATNYSAKQDEPMALDGAFVRRFDRSIMVDMPSKENRLKFLEQQIRKRPVFRVGAATIESLAERSVGMSLSNLASMLNQAVRAALQENLIFITDDTLAEALDKYREGEKHETTPEASLRTARHESGHALISWLSGEKPAYLTIVSRGGYGGYMQHASDEKRQTYTRRELLDRIRTSLAGRAAEIVYYGPEEGISTGASSDLRNATELAVGMLNAYGMDDAYGLAAFSGRHADKPDDQLRNRVNQLLYRELNEAIKQIESHRAAMDALVAALQAATSLKAEEIDDVLTKNT